MHPCRSVQRVRCLQARKARSSRSVLDRTSCDTGKRLAHRLWATVTGDRCTPVGSGATAGHHVCLPVPLRRRRPDARLSSSRPGCTRPQQCQQSTSSHSCFHSCASAARSTQCGHTSNANAVCNRRFAAFLCYKARTSQLNSRHHQVALRLRSLRFHSPRLCRVAVFLIQTNVSLSHHRPKLLKHL